MTPFKSRKNITSSGMFSADTLASASAKRAQATKPRTPRVSTISPITRIIVALWWGWILQRFEGHVFRHRWIVVTKRGIYEYPTKFIASRAVKSTHGAWMTKAEWMNGTYEV